MQELRIFTTRQIILRQRMAVAAIDVMVRALAFRLALDGKANFNPNQPRIPRGRSDGGRWTGDGEAPPAREPTPPADWDFWPQASTDDLPVVLANFDPPVPPGDEEPPKVPAERPKTSSERVAVLRDVARWMGRAARAGTAIGRAVSLASWLDRYNVVMQSYNDPPKSLEELQARVGTKNFGYDVHHIVEKAGAEADGYPRSMINDRDNLVLIPRMKHWELNAWYETRTRQFGMMTPRQYLRGKSWLERRQVGLIGLRKIKVMIDE